MQTRKLYLLPLVVGSFLLIGIVLFWPTLTANAQCGSQASSCKTCHETQNAKPVNNDGNGWHTGHAFGDFCYSCHGGNNQSMVKDEAHTGMVPPMSDIKIACAGCHPDDLNERAKKYADALGITLGAASAATSAPAGDQSTVEPAAAQPQSTSQPAPVVVVAAPQATKEIDYVALYAGETGMNWGDVILGVLIFLVATGGGVFIYANERKLRGLPMFGFSAAGHSVEANTAPKVPGYSDEVAALLPLIARLDPVGLHALKRILEKPDQANEMLHSLSHLDSDLIRRLRSLDKDSRSLLMALAGD